MLFRVNSSTVVTIRGLKATEEGKPASVKVSFKVKKTGKTSKYSYVSKVNVIEDKYTLTAAATAVKEITLTFNKAVKDTTAAKVVVKKGNTTPTFTATWADDAKSAVLAMDSKMTAGTYDITVSGVETEDLTASVTVEDQKLNSFELLSTNLVANAVPVSYGSVKFRALDQYGKPMKADNVTVTSSFGYTGTYASNGSFSKAANYQISVKDSEPAEVVFEITPALAILGTKGTITIVSDKGVSLKEELTLVEAAQAAKVENLGLYNTNKGKFMDMTAGDKVADYVIALKFTDQYDAAIKAADVANIQATMSGGLTNVASGVLADEIIKINDEDVYAVRLSAANGTDAKAGSMQVIVVNTRRTLLDTLNFDVLPGTVIKSFSVSADGDIYADEDNTLSYTAIDADGNEVTKYDVINKALTNGLPGDVKVKKQADGTAKLVYNNNTQTTNTDATTYKGSDNVVLTFTLYPGEINTIVHNTSIKVNQKREIWEVTGIDSKVTTATVTGGSLTFKPTDLKIADQYGNTLTTDQVKKLYTSTNVTGTAIDTNWTVSDAATATADITVTAKNGATAKVTFAVKQVGTHKDDGYTVTFSVVDSAKATDYAIEWLKDLNVFSVSDGAIEIGKDNVTCGAATVKNEEGDAAGFRVVGKVGGKKVVIPKEQYVIVSGNKQDQVKVDPDKDRITKEGTLTVAVDDEDHNTNVITATYTYTNANPKLAAIKVKDVKTNLTVSGGAKGISEIVDAAFDLRDQFGKKITVPSDMKAEIVVTGVGNKGIVKYNNTNQATIEKDGANQLNEITVTLTYGDITQTTTVTCD